jgi:hypothetical protein
MRRSLVPFSGPEVSSHTLSLVGFITTTSGFRFSVQTGVWERLQVCPETLKVLDDKGIEVEVLQTEAAVKCFNELIERVPAGGLFHSTC